MCDAPVAPAFSPVIIAVIVIIVVVIIIVVAVLLFLVWLWKFRNDAFYHYVCCCVYGGTKSQINSLQQENQRLRHELSQQKLSSSARFSQGMIGE